MAEAAGGLGEFKERGSFFLGVTVLFSILLPHFSCRFCLSIHFPLFSSMYHIRADYIFRKQQRSGIANELYGRRFHEIGQQE
jgi:hypothetical protein